MAKVNRLTDLTVAEVSLVFKNDPETGVEYAPRNSDAQFLGVKAKAKPMTLLESFQQAFKDARAIDTGKATEKKGDLSDPSVAAVLNEYADLRNRMDGLSGKLESLGITGAQSSASGRSGPKLSDDRPAPVYDGGGMVDQMTATMRAQRAKR